LAIGHSGIKGKRDPKRHADGIRFVTCEQQTTSRGIARFALLGFLTKRRDPAEPYGKA
jgi:hypothetical protein